MDCMDVGYNSMTNLVFLNLLIFYALVKTPKAEAKNKMNCFQEKLGSSVLKVNFNLSAYHSDDDSWLTVC